MIYFTSDLHFYHENILKLASRPFSNADEMNSALIKNWNARVNPPDEVYILGDVTLKGGAHAAAALAQLNGRKYLVKGNHDHYTSKANFDKNIFEWVKDYHELKYQNEFFILFHYPIDDWNQRYHGSINLHGHLHSNMEYNQRSLADNIRRYDVGVDANNMSPVSIEEIIVFFGGL